MVTPATKRRLPKAAIVSKLAFYAALPVAMIVASTLVGTASYSGFNAVVSNTGNTWSAGTVAVTSDDAGVSILNDTNIQPGSSNTSCITVKNSSSISAPVKLYAKNTGADATVAQAVYLTIDEGTGGSFSSCSGFTKQTNLVTNLPLSTVEANNSSYSTGLATGLTTAGTTKTYQFTYTMPASAANKWQGLVSTTSFFWEAQK